MQVKCFCCSHKPLNVNSDSLFLSFYHSVASGRGSSLVLHLGNGLLFVAASVCLSGCQAKSETHTHTKLKPLCNILLVFRWFPLHFLSFCVWELNFRSNGQTQKRHHWQPFFFAQCNPNVVFLLFNSDYTLDYLLWHHNFGNFVFALILKLSGCEIFSKRSAHTVKFTEIKIEGK